MAVWYREKLAKELAGVSLQTLEETPERSLKLLRGIGNNTVIRSSMQRRGYDKAVHEAGWRLLAAVAGMAPPKDTSSPTDPEVVQAVEEIDPYDEELVEITDASLGRKFEEQRKYLLEGITPATGMGAVLNVALFLKRAEELDKGQERKASRKKDQEAMKLLAVRGITPELRKHLAGLVKTAKSAKPVGETDEAAIKAADEAYVTALADLRGWYDEWSRIARVVVKRRDYLMLLGLAHRKSPTGTEEEPGVPTGGT